MKKVHRLPHMHRLLYWIMVIQSHIKGVSMKIKVALIAIAFSLILNACSKNSDDSNPSDSKTIDTEASIDKPQPQKSSVDTVSNFSTCLNEIRTAQSLIDSTLAVFSRAFGDYEETVNLRTVSANLTELKLYLSSTETTKNKKAKAELILQDSVQKVEPIRDSVFRMVGNVQEYRDLDKSLTSLKHALESIK